MFGIMAIVLAAAAFQALGARLTSSALKDSTEKTSIHEVSDYIPGLGIFKKHGSARGETNGGNIETEMRQPGQTGRVNELYTIGAVGAGIFPDDSSSGKGAAVGATVGGCMPGLRMWNEDRFVSDFAPAFSGYPHLPQSILVLKDGESKYIDCAKVGWKTSFLPLKFTAEFGLVQFTSSSNPLASALHQSKLYTDRIQKAMTSGQPAASTMMQNAMDGAIAAREVYQSCEKAKTNIAAGSTWKLVFFATVKSNLGAESDNMLVTQNGNLDCFLAFEGSNTQAEIYVSNGKGAVGPARAYCGGKFNRAYVKHLIHLTSSKQWNEVKVALSKCRNVNVAGHSLGGAVAELFSTCQKQGSDRKANNDFKRQTWTTGSASAMSEFTCPKQAGILPSSKEREER